MYIHISHHIALLLSNSTNTIMASFKTNQNANTTTDASETLFKLASEAHTKLLCA
ncbi:hypothetical protein GGI42DRAFT_323547 [Trichoderma sp. SZMC 28013]